MLDGVVQESVDMVWGFAVPTSGTGRRKWPETLRAIAVIRVAAGEEIREISEEIGANKSLVALWVKNAAHDSAAPAFFEVVPPSEPMPSHKQSTTHSALGATATCRISIGGADIAMTPDYPADHLAAVLRAVRASL